MSVEQKLASFVASLKPSTRASTGKTITVMEEPPAGWQETQPIRIIQKACFDSYFEVIPSDWVYDQSLAMGHRLLENIRFLGGGRKAVDDVVDRMHVICEGPAEAVSRCHLLRWASNDPEHLNLCQHAMMDSMRVTSSESAATFLDWLRDGYELGLNRIGHSILYQAVKEAQND